MMHNRDPFAREELHSKREYDPVFQDGHKGCAWCGRLRHTRYKRGLGRPWLYRFRIETDGGRVYEDRHLFCSRECRGAYGGHDPRR